MVVFVFLGLVGLVKLKVLFYSEGNFLFRFCLKVLFLRFVLFSNFENDSNLQEDLAKSGHGISKKKSKNKQQKTEHKSSKEQSIFEKLGLVGLLFKPTVDLFKFLNKGFKIKDFKLNFELSKKDAYSTAIFYGNFCYFFHCFFKFFCSVCRVEVDHIKIVPNFKTEESSYGLSLCMQISIGRLFLGLLKYILTIVILIFLKKMRQNSELKA